MNCPYGQCRMRNLCRSHCVRQALEKDGWDLQPDGDLKARQPAPPSSSCHGSER